MAILKVARMGHPVLRRPARKVTKQELASPEIQKFIDDMIETMHEYQGIGLAAPQVHQSLKISVIQLPEETGIEVFVNPEIEIVGKDKNRYWEGCLSVPGLRGLVERPGKLRCKYLNRDGEAKEVSAEGFLATVFQHEFDHLDGTLYVDKVVEKKLVFDEEYEKYWLPDAEDGELPD